MVEILNKNIKYINKYLKVRIVHNYKQNKHDTNYQININIYVKYFSGQNSPQLQAKYNLSNKYKYIKYTFQGTNSSQLQAKQARQDLLTFNIQKRNDEVL